MIIGILSDIHDQFKNLANALEIFKDHEAEALIFCGDFCSPIAARAISQYPGDVHCIFGNCDGDRFAIASYANAEAPNLKIHGEWAELELGERKIAVTHYPIYGAALARTGDWDAVFSGHTHEAHKDRFDECLWLNPGETLGWKAAPTVAIYDTSSNDGVITTT